MRVYEVVHVEETVPLTGRVEGTVWETASVAPIDSFEWHNRGPRPMTEVRVLHDGEMLWLQF